ncbi:MAG: hypothetical protein CUN52_07150 [Phototrophicales bacterium]|nr:MAG: hypothetical protein CUN52_07150 [Phototrophicales bacterium]
MSLTETQIEQINLAGIYNALNIWGYIRLFADKLSDMNKSQSEALNIYWVELSALNDYRQFYDVLQKLNIPSKPFTDDLESALEPIFATLFS